MFVKEILRITKGELLSGDPRTSLRPDRISTDSRSIKKGEFFIALKGANFDGSVFVEDALKAGAAGAIFCDADIRPKDSEKVLIKVVDTTDALQKIAAHHRAGFKIPVIAITGSNGKTTVKEMAAHLLSARYEVLKNEGTKNNHVGVPLTLLKMNSSHEMCVLELGMNHKGEISALGRIARPDVAVITNIGPSHLEYFNDLDEVLEAKSEIFERMKKGGLAVINGDDAYLSKIKRKVDIVRFGLGEKNDCMAGGIEVSAGSISFKLNGRSRFRINLIGVHNVYNALAALAVARKFGLSLESIRRRLASYRPVSMRLDVKDVGGIKVINDAYNSNPMSMKCALEALVRYPARSRWVVSGDMLELGARSEEFHRAIGREVALSGANGLFTVGKLSRLMSEEALGSGMDQAMTRHCSSHDEAAALLKKVAKKGDAILVKGSRAMRMEEVINKLIVDS